MPRFFRAVADMGLAAEMISGVSEAAVELGRHGVDARLLPSQPSGFPMWLIDAARFAPESLEYLLSDAERERAARYRVDALRGRYIAAHGSLRLLLRHCCGISFEDQVPELNAFGKPRLERFPRLHYSMSYSANYVLLGLNEGDEIGVDIEVCRPIPDAADLAEMNYTPKERAGLRTRGQSDAEVSRAFLNIWVRKEACVKAFGQGLSIPLTEVECSSESRTMLVCLGEHQYQTGIIQAGGDPIMAWARKIQTYPSVNSIRQ